MAIPGYQTFMLPLLRALADGQEHRVIDLVYKLADEFHITEEERAQLLPSGQGGALSDTVLYNRIQWARAYMKQAGLVESPGRGIVRISDEGRRLLEENHSSITLQLLMRYPSFVAFRERSGVRVAPRDGISDRPTTCSTSDAPVETPEEAFERLWKGLRDETGAELLERIRVTPPDFFERLVVQLLA